MTSGALGHQFCTLLHFIISVLKRPTCAWLWLDLRITGKSFFLHLKPVARIKWKTWFVNSKNNKYNFIAYFCLMFSEYVASVTTLLKHQTRILQQSKHYDKQTNTPQRRPLLKDFRPRSSTENIWTVLQAWWCHQC